MAEARLIISNKLVYTPLKAYEVTSFIDGERGCNTTALDIKPTTEYLRICIKLASTLGCDGRVYEIEPLSKMIDSILVTRSGYGVVRGTETSRIYYGQQLWLLSYLNDEPHSGLLIGADRQGYGIIDFPYIPLTSHDVHINVAFRKDLNPHLDVVDIELYALPISTSHKIIGHSLKQSLVPKGSTCLNIKDTKVLCGFVLHARGCKIQDMQLELRDANNVIIGYEDDAIRWNTLNFVTSITNNVSRSTNKSTNNSSNNLHAVAEEIQPAIIHECLFACCLPWLNTTNNLRLHIRGVGIELLRTVDITYVALHAPENEGWVLIERGAHVSNDSRMRAMKNYLASWMKMPSWAKKKVVVLPPPTIITDILDDYDEDIPTALEVALAREDDSREDGVIREDGLEEIPLPHSLLRPYSPQPQPQPQPDKQ